MNKTKLADILDPEKNSFNLVRLAAKDA